VSRISKQTELLLADDPRLIGAVEVAIRHAAAHNGMSATAETALERMARDLCHAALAGSNGNNGHAPSLRVRVHEFPDRVEVVLEHSGKALRESKKARRPAFSAVSAGFAPAAEAEPTFANGNGVDQVVREDSGGCTRITLVQGCHTPHTHS
jgi:hypothetical protein